jgi:hypothetical protein
VSNGADGAGRWKGRFRDARRSAQGRERRPVFALGRSDTSSRQPLSDVTLQAIGRQWNRKRSVVCQIPAAMLASEYRPGRRVRKQLGEIYGNYDW